MEVVTGLRTRYLSTAPGRNAYFKLKEFEKSVETGSSLVA